MYGDLYVIKGHGQRKYHAIKEYIGSMNKLKKQPVRGVTIPASSANRFGTGTLFVFADVTEALKHLAFVLSYPSFPSILSGHVIN